MAREEMLGVREQLDILPPEKSKASFLSLCVVVPRAEMDLGYSWGVIALPTDRNVRNSTPLPLDGLGDVIIARRLVNVSDEDRRSIRRKGGDGKSHLLVTRAGHFQRGLISLQRQDKCGTMLSVTTRQGNNIPTRSRMT